MTLRVATASVIDVDMGCWPLQRFVKTGKCGQVVCQTLIPLIVERRWGVILPRLRCDL